MQHILVQVAGRAVIREYFEDGWLDFVSDQHAEATEAEEFSRAAAEGVLSINRRLPEFDKLIRH
jgi:hypothetical protein